MSSAVLAGTGFEIQRVYAGLWHVRRVAHHQLRLESLKNLRRGVRPQVGALKSCTRVQTENSRILLRRYDSQRIDIEAEQLAFFFDTQQVQSDEPASGGQLRDSQW